MQTITIGLDIAKSVFQVPAIVTRLNARSTRRSRIRASRYRRPVACNYGRSAILRARKNVDDTLIAQGTLIIRSWCCKHRHRRSASLPW